MPAKAGIHRSAPLNCELGPMSPETVIYRDDSAPLCLRLLAA